MAAPTVQAVQDEARLVFLNDSGEKLYTDARLLPFTIKAYRDLQVDMVDRGISVGREISSALTLAANTLTISSSSSPALPTDLLYPLKLDEKRVGELDTAYVDMTEQTWEPDVEQTDRLRYWAWREDEIKLVGAVGSTIVRIKYFKSLTAITSVEDTIPILDSDGFIAARTAALAAATIGKNFSLAQAINQEAESLKETFLSSQVKNRQNQTIRMKPFRAFPRYWGRR